MKSQIVWNFVIIERNLKLYCIDGLLSIHSEILGSRTAIERETALNLDTLLERRSRRYIVVDSCKISILEQFIKCIMGLVWKEIDNRIFITLKSYTGRKTLNHRYLIISFLLRYDLFMPQFVCRYYELVCCSNKTVTCTYNCLS